MKGRDEPTNPPACEPSIWATSGVKPTKNTMRVNQQLKMQQSETQQPTSNTWNSIGIEKAFQKTHQSTGT